MIKKILINFGFMYLFLFVLNFLHAINIDLQNKCLLPSVKLLSYAKKSIGSGVIIKSYLMKDKSYSNIVISCNHVTKNNKIIIELTNINNKVECYYSTVIYENQINDISIIQFRTDEKQAVAEIDFKNDIFIADDIISVGYGLSNLPKLGYGKIITQKQNDKLFKGTFFTNIPMVMGDSGGPIYKDNKLIAISQAIRVIEWNETILPFPNISVIIPINKLIEINKEESGKLRFIIEEKSSPPMFPHLFLQMQEFDKILIK